MFQLNDNEFADWKSQIVTSNQSQEVFNYVNMGLRRNPYAFTEQGIRVFRELRVLGFLTLNTQNLTLKT